MANPLIHLSRHAKERLRERHDKHLLRYEDQRSFELSCYELLDRAEDTHRHHNDTALMTRLYADYGYDQRFSFKVHANALFIIVNNICVTVLDTSIHSYSRQFVQSTPVAFKPKVKQQKPSTDAGPAYRAMKRRLNEQ